MKPGLRSPLLIVCACLAAALSAQDKPQIRFTDTAAASGVTVVNLCGGKETKDYIVEINGNGAAFFDYDNDDDMDLLVVNGSTLDNMAGGGDPMAVLYRNDGDGTFSDVTEAGKLSRSGWGMGACVADYDNDGHQDVYLTAYGSDVLYKNNGAGAFVDATEKAGVANPGWATNCAFGDYDLDGDVDLYVANYLRFDLETVPKRGANELCKYMGRDVLCGPRGLEGEPDVLYRNNGDGTFSDVTKDSGAAQPAFYGFGVVFTDLNNDLYPEIYVANDSKPSFLFANRKNGTFSEEGLFAGVALNAAGTEQASMGVAVGDYNNDGSMDLFITNFSQDSNVLYQNDGSAFFTDVTFPAGLGSTSMAYLGWGTSFVDIDNDGFLDLFIANGHVYPEIDTFEIESRYHEPRQVYRNLGDGRFQELTSEIAGPLVDKKSSRGAAFADYDNDGDIDILVVNMNEPPSLLRNDTASGHHWIGFRLAGTKSNRDGIGARVTLSAGGMRQTREVRSGGSYLSHNDFRAAFRTRAGGEDRGRRSPLAERPCRNLPGARHRPLPQAARRRRGRRGLTCISHHPTVEARHTTAMTSLRLLAVLNVLFKYACARQAARAFFLRPACA